MLLKIKEMSFKRILVYTFLFIIAFKIVFTIGEMLSYHVCMLNDSGNGILQLYCESSGFD